MVNRLDLEKSLYLRQHAKNPVDWYPWGEEAFLAAKQRDCPIFLSIGYSSCHWCHVMEKEAFSDPEIGAFLNASFINIKVDKEERPEVNNLYMECARLLMGTSGGWPLNIVLTPDRRPFFAVTYLPLEAQRGLLSFKEFITEIHNVWQGKERSLLVEQAKEVLSYLERPSVNSRDMPTNSFIELYVDLFLKLIDPVFGGMKGEPKFPLSIPYFLLFAIGKKWRGGKLLFFLELSLHKMYEGGLFDHIGGGFFRYSVDSRWHIPHFEKMLIHNALLAATYLEAWKGSKTTLYETICKKTLDYVLRELRDSSGGFIAAEDADSDGMEGAYYVWSLEEIRNALTPIQFQVFSLVYECKIDGDFQGKNVLHLLEPLEDALEHSGLDKEVFYSSLKEAKKKLLDLRLKRTPLLKDTQVISAWNGAMIDVLLKAASAFGEKRYKESAEKALCFIRENLWKEKRLFRCFREGKASIEGCLDDYAYCIKASLTSFEEGKGVKWLIWALELSEVLKKFFEKEGGGFYLSKQDPFLFFRPFDFYDEAEPSGNSIHAENLVRLYQITAQKPFLVDAERLFVSMRGVALHDPLAVSYGLFGLHRLLDEKAVTIIVALNKDQTGREEIAKTLGSVYRPLSVTIWLEEEDQELRSVCPYLKEKTPKLGKTTLYICFRDRCDPPIHDLSEILRAVQNF